MKLKQQLGSARTLRLAGWVACSLLLFLVGNMIFPPTPTIQTYADEPAQAVGSSITITTAGTIALDLMPTSSNGTFAKSSAGAFSVTTTNATGYTLKLKSVAANGTDLKYVYNNDTYIIPTLAENTSITETVFGNTSDYNNKWGYKPSKLNSVTNENYKPAPSADGDTLDVTEQANAVANDYSITLGARADYTAKAGSYTNTFVIEAVANVLLLTVEFDGNGLQFANGSNTNVVRYDATMVTTDSAVQYSHTPNFTDGSSTPSVEYGGNDYVSAVNVPNASSLSVDLYYGMEDELDTYYVCVLSGSNPLSSDSALISALNFHNAGGINPGPGFTTQYGVNTVCFDDDSYNVQHVVLSVTGNTATFVWFYTSGPTYESVYGYYAEVTGAIESPYNDLVSGSYATPSVISGQQTFYGWSTTANGEVVYANENDIINSNLGSNGDTVTLYAVWDGELLPIMQEVADWGDELDEGDEVTATDSRDGKTYTVAKLADGNIWMTQNLDFDIVDGGSELDYTNTDVPEEWDGAGDLLDTDGFYWNGSIDIPESYDPGDVCWLGEEEYEYDETCEDRHYHLGNYYNWTAAVAMSDSSSYDQEGTDVDQSICPAGWRLPLADGGEEAKSFYNLVSQYDWNRNSYMMEGSYIMWESPLYFPLSGYWDGYLHDIGSFGYFQSSVVYDDSFSYKLDIERQNNHVDPEMTDYMDRGEGYSVRCVAR